MDYEKVGLIAGIEIHQQLEGKKLFCDCPTSIRDEKVDPPSICIKRKLRAVVGETGLIDAAAAKEQAKSKTYEYNGYDTTCLVEFDEEPPHLMNKGALNLCLQLCKHLGCRVVDEVQTMRKTVVDGSNTSGFQRTALIGFAGSFTLQNGKDVSVPTVLLEEDAAKIIEKTPDVDSYNVSRLGIPLIEIGTGPDLRTPEEAKEAAEKLGMYLRSLTQSQGQSVKRGLGTIRQDVNVSIKGGKRVEVKGAQDLKMITTLIDNEITRQQILLELQSKFSSAPECGDFVDVTDVLKNTSCGFVKTTIDNGGVILARKVQGFKGIFGKETMPGRRVGSEISDYAKLAGVGGIIHSDEQLEKKYKFTAEEISTLSSTLDVQGEDAFIMVADVSSKAQKAMEYAKERIARLSEGVISEVRKANADGTTSYMRPMPGGARMYPETDTLPLKISLDAIEIGETIEEQIPKVMAMGVKDKDIAEIIVKEYADMFGELVCRIPDMEVNTIATNIVSLQSKFADVLTTEIFHELFQAMQAGTIPMNGAESVLELVAKGKSITDSIEANKSMPKEAVEKIVDEVLATLSDDEKSKMGLVMGRVMAASKGKADGKIVSQILREKL